MILLFLNGKQVLLEVIWADFHDWELLGKLCLEMESESMPMHDYTRSAAQIAFRLFAGTNLKKLLKVSCFG